MTNREIDALVATHVTDGVCRCVKDGAGWSIHGYGSGGGICHNCLKPHHAPHYSSDPLAAKQVREKLLQFCSRVELHILRDGAVCMTEVDSGEPSEHYTAEAEADTEEMATCLCALKSVGIEVEASTGKEPLSPVGL